MKINFEITEQDIKEYLKRHKEDENIKYREAMFVKYMREQEGITCESLEILTKKYNWEDRVINGTYQYDHLGILKQESLPNFNSYLNGIHNLDISGICHIMVPIAAYYYPYKYYARMNPHPKQMLSLLVNKMNIVDEDTNDNHLYSVTYDTIDNYSVTFKNKVCRDSYGIFISLSQEKSRRMIQEYSSIYGEEPVKQIRKIIRERMK